MENPCFPERPCSIALLHPRVPSDCKAQAESTPPLPVPDFVCLKFQPIEKPPPVPKKVREGLNHDFVT